MTSASSASNLGALAGAAAVRREIHAALETSYLAAAEPAEFERLEGHQHATHGRSRPPRTARQQGYPTVFAGEHVDHEAGFTIGMQVQNVGRLAVDTLAHGVTPDRTKRNRKEAYRS